MASIEITNLDDDVEERLRQRAARNGRSLEDEVRTILSDAVRERKSRSRNLMEITRMCFGPAGGVELELPPRGPMREPPRFA